MIKNKGVLYFDTLSIIPPILLNEYFAQTIKKGGNPALGQND